MVAITMYDTHAAIKRLEAVGFPLNQAETIVAEHVKVMSEGELATKQDIKDLRQEMKNLEMRIIVRLSTVMVTLTGILFAALKFT